MSVLKVLKEKKQKTQDSNAYHEAIKKTANMVADRYD